MKILAGFLIFVPLTAVLELLDADPRWVFGAATVAIIPLAGCISLATEDLARRVGAVGGSLLNATFSNAAELIIALFALRAGLVDLVKASVVGAVVGNVLLVLGASALVGGCFYKVQRFHSRLARNHAGMLLLAVAALLVPTVFHHTRPGLHGEEMHGVSVAVAVMLLCTYGLYLLHTLKTHPAQPERSGKREPPRWSLAKGIGILTGSVSLIAWLSDALVTHAEAVMRHFSISPLFLGFIVIPFAGNAAEYGLALSMAVKNRMNLAVGVAVVSSIQAAFLLAPLLVLLSRLLTRPLTLVFNLLEVTALSTAVLVANRIAADGETTWFEGVQLLAAYLILLFAFYFV